MEQKVIELIESIKNLAPEAWEVLVRQQIIEGWSLAFVSALLVIFGVWITPKADDDAKPIVVMAWATFAILFGVLAFHNLINPEFQAIQELLPR